MKTVLIIASLFGIAWAASVPHHEDVFTLQSVDPVFALQNKKILELLRYIKQVDKSADYYTVGKDYDIGANIDNYSNKQAVKEFLSIYQRGVLQRDHLFSVTKEKMVEEAVALFRVLYYAKDFDTFYKTAAFSRLHFNQGQFVYALFVAVLHRPDTKNYVLPAPYEVFPNFYVNSDVVSKMYRWKMENSSSAFEDKYLLNHAIHKAENKFFFYANYSDIYSYSHGEERLAYFMEDIGWNSYYYYLNLYNPFWLKGSRLGAYKEYRGEIYYYEFQRMLARYNMERQSNGLTEIPTFSWYAPLKYGYTPYLYLKYPFLQRQDNYKIPYKYENELQFVSTFESTFIQFLEEGHFKAYGQEVDFHNSGALNFVSNYWFNNIDLYEKAGPRSFVRNYELTARQLLSGAHQLNSKYSFWPSALSFYQTTLRDPMSYQLYERILQFFYQYKQYLEPYTQNNLHYSGVKITNVIFSKLETFFEYFDYDASNAIVYTEEELKDDNYYKYEVRQPRLNHKLFSTHITIKSDIAGEVMIKIFMGPKFNFEGYPTSLESDWMNFIEIDRFTYNITQGQNTIERKSEQFSLFQEDYATFSKLYESLQEGKVPTYMHSKTFDYIPNRLMLPKGRLGGYPVKFFIMVYPYVPASDDLTSYPGIILDKKPLGYPLDRPAKAQYFNQPNMYFKEELIYDVGETHSYIYNTPEYVYPDNTVPEH